MEISSGDTAWILISSALVMLMTPGLALFYGGLTRSKNVLGDDHAELHHARRDQRPVRDHRLQPRLRARPRRPHRRLRLVRPQGRLRLRAERGLRADDPAPDLHDLPADVRRDHAGADHGRLRRAREVQHLPGLHAPLGDPGLRPGRALGLGRRRLAGRHPRRRRQRRHQGARLRRRHRRPHQRRYRGAGGGDPLRQAPRLRPRADGAARHHDGGDRRCPALVRLVRLQRR